MLNIYVAGDEYEIIDPAAESNLVAELRALECHLVADYPRATGFPVDEDTARDITRALDHLRNAGEANDEIIKARDAVLFSHRWPPLTYRLRSWEFDGTDITFWSYTGEYVESDRLVAGDKELSVVSVAQQATPVEDGVLVVEAWRRRTR